MVLSELLSLLQGWGFLVILELLEQLNLWRGDAHICKRGGLQCLTWFSAGAKSHSEGPWASTGGTPPSETTLPCATFNYCCTSIVYYSALPLTQSHWEYGKEQYPLVSTAPRVGGGGVGQPPAVSICQSWELESEYISILQSPTILTTNTNHIIFFLEEKTPLKHKYGRITGG